MASAKPPPRLTIGQKKNARNAAQAAAPVKRKAGGDAIDDIIALVNKRLEGQGRVYRGSAIHDRGYSRRSSGVPSVDAVLGGGYPKGGIVMIGGEYSSGKTSVILEGLAHEQRTHGGACAWIALEPFSKRWARERGFFIPFCEDEILDVETGEMRPADSWANASPVEQLRMQQAGIEDPYTEVSPFVLVEEERGDVALDVAIDLLKTNKFAYIVVDSLGVARNTKWLEETEVQDSGDFPREAKMIGDYTARALLTMNRRYDANGNQAKDGQQFNQTTLVHINHIGTEIGTQARAKHKTQRIKGGEGSKHNHHVILFLWKGEQYRVEGPPPDKRPYVYAQETNVMATKSKICAPFMSGSYDMYFQPFGSFQPGDIDIVKDAVGIALVHDVIKRNGAWYDYGELHVQGRPNLEEAIRADEALKAELLEFVRKAVAR